MLRNLHVLAETLSSPFSIAAMTGNESLEKPRKSMKDLRNWRRDGD
jgi:hypothetical protein